MRVVEDDHRELVPARVAATNARVVHGAVEHLWRSFDGAPHSRARMLDDSVEFEVDFGREERLRGLRVTGAAAGRLTVLRSAADGQRVGDVSAATAVATDGALGGLDQVAVALGDGEERSFELRSPERARAVRVRWQRTDRSTSLPEIEWLGLVRSSTLAPPARLAEQLFGRERSGTTQFVAAPASRSIAAPTHDRDATSSTFRVSVDGDPSRCARAFIRFELTGLGHWTAARYRIGELESAPSFAATRPGNAGVSVEEIPPSLLQPGENSIEFLPVSEVDPLGYTVSNLTLVCVTDPALRDVVPAAAPRAGLTDGQVHEVGAGRALGNDPLQWRFAIESRPRAISFFVAQPGASTLEVRHPAVERPVRIDLTERRSGWHTETLPAQWPAADSIRISVHGSREAGASVSEVAIDSTPMVGAVAEPQIVVTWPLHGECVGGTVHVRGFIRHPLDAAAWELRLGDRTARLDREGRFSLSAERLSDSIDLVAIRGQQRLAVPIRLSQCAASAPFRAVSQATADEAAPYSEWVIPEQPARLAFSGATLEVPAHAVAARTRLSMRALARADVPAMQEGMTNVTSGGAAFRMGPHPMRFLRALKLSIDVEPSLLPAGKTTDDVRLYFFDESARRWRVLPRAESGRAGAAAATTDHFTVFAAATSSDPDSPGAGGEGGSSLGGVQPGHPASGVTSIAPPSPNSLGSANLSYPLVLPPGRRGMAPQLALNYSNTNGNGWLGVGWSLGVSTIEVDTSNGVPRYDGTQTYRLDGAELVKSGAEIGGVQRYIRRVEGSFDRIERRSPPGSRPYWVVTDRSGMRSVYGRSLSSRLSSTSGGVEQNTFAWMLELVVDPFGNAVRYGYEMDDASLAGDPTVMPPVSETAYQRYLSNIQYTSKVDSNDFEIEPPAFTVWFSRSRGRADTSLSGRAGFLVRTRDRLEWVAIYNGGSLVRWYWMNYRDGDFGKQLLETVSQFSGTSQRLQMHAFQYASAMSGGSTGFGAVRRWDVPGAGRPIPSALGHDDSESENRSFHLGIGDPFNIVSLSGSVGGSEGIGHARDTTVDVNGDGLPDFLSDTGAVALNGFHRPSAGSVDRGQGALSAFSLTSLAQTGLSESESGGYHATGGATYVGGAGLGYGADHAISGTWDNRLLIDADGDGFVDMLHFANLPTGPVLHVRENPFVHGRASFGPTGNDSLDPADRDYSIGGLIASPRLRRTESTEAMRLRGLSFAEDVVLAWTAQQTGTVRLQGSILRPSVAGSDGVRVTIWKVHGTFAEIAPAATQIKLWEKTIAVGEPACEPTNGVIDACGTSGYVVSVENGDRIYMQVHALSEIDDDVVSWDPKFTYESYGPCVTPPNESGPPGGCVSNPPPALVFQRSTDFRVADRDFVGWQAPAWGTVRVEGTVTLGGTTPRTLTVYRRRSPLPFDPAAAPPSEAAIAAHLGAAPAYAQDPIASVTLNPGVNSLVGGAAIELAHTQLGDQLLFHVSVDRDVDPSTVSAWDLNVRYTSFCLNPASEDNCRTVEPCGVDPHWVGSGTSNRVCALGGAPRSGSEPWRIGENLIVRATIPSIDWLPPSTAWQRRSTEVGWWRNWGVFAWNGSQPAPLDQFHESGMKEPFGAGTSAQSAFDAWRMGGPLPAPRSVALAPRFTADELRVGTGSVSLPAGHWRGGGVDAFVTASSLKPSAMSTSRVGPTGEIESWTSSRDRYTTAPVMRQSESESHGSHLSVGPISANMGTSSHRTIRDFVDMNGDGLPDAVAAYDSGVMDVQFLKRRVAGSPVSEFEASPTGVSTRAAAGLRRSESATNRGGFTVSSASSGGSSGGGTSASASDTRSETRSGEYSSVPVRVGIGSAVSTSNTKRDLMDINGDGLPDLVEIRPANNPMLAPATMVVQYNLGYRMSNPVSMQLMWPASEASNISRATNGLRMQQSCSFEGAFGFWFAGAGTTHGDSVNYSSMVDMNADGLPDRVLRDPALAGWWVQFNLGTTFSAPVQWNLADWPAATGATIVSRPCAAIGTDPAVDRGDLRDALSFERRATFNFGQSIPITFPLLILSLQFVPNWGEASDRGEAALDLTDIDGDSAPDHVLRTSSGVFARLNTQMGRSNLLTQVTGPMGDKIQIEYGREGNHVRVEGGRRFDMPSNRWVMSSVTVSDGRNLIPGMSASSHQTTFDYFESGNYSRQEREFLGFAHVRSTRSDGAHSDVWYHNQDVQHQGLVEAEVSYDASGNILSRSTQEYELRETTYGFSGSHYVWRTTETDFVYDGTSSDVNASLYSSSSVRELDSQGRLQYVTDYRTAAANDDLRTEITYFSNSLLNIERASKVTLRQVATGTVLRETQSDWRPDGTLIQRRTRLIGGRDPTTDNAYDVFTATDVEVNTDGNVVRVTDPSGYWVERHYDSALRTYVESTVDAFGYTSSATYDHRFGVLTSMTDANGHTSSVSLDDFGRVTAIRGPNDPAPGPAAITFEYSMGNLAAPQYPAYARSYRRDDSNPGNTVESVVMLDGFGRVLQSKREVEVDNGLGGTVNGWTVSGRVFYDALGRVESAGQPTFDAMGAHPATSFVPLLVALHPVSYEYDNFGRVKKQTAPEGSTKIQYGFETFDGELRHVSVVTDVAGHSARAWNSFEGEPVAVTHRADVDGVATDLITRYQYDVLGQLTRVEDANGNVTTAEYDSFGRMVTHSTPDTGMTEFQYSLAGDLGARITQNLRNDGKKIRYQYNYHRLSVIDYPSSADVVYTYGGPGAAFNRAGRVISVADGTGTQEWRYGALGEVVWEHRQIDPVGGMSTPLQTTMLFQHDSGGRLTGIDYPDGEHVAYSYNMGGMLNHVQGVIDGAARYYINNIRYDHFGDRVYTAYGNGTESRVERHADTRRVWRVNTDSPFGPIQRLEFGYTPTGLVSSINNNVPVAPWSNGPSSQTFNYDESEQLTSASGSFDYGGSIGTRAYSLNMRYDRIGNVRRMTQNDIMSPAGGSPYAVTDTTRDAVYQYNGTPHAASQVGGKFHWYDANGNQAYSTDYFWWWRSMSWDEENRLTSVNEAGTTTSFRYDAGGQRVAKLGSSTMLYPSAYVTVNNGSTVTKHVFAGGERVSSIVRTAGDGSAGERQYWLHSDSGGASQYVTGAGGWVTTHNETLPFGEPWITQDWSWDQVARSFRGSERDGETRLHHMGARYYDASEARWTSADPALSAFTAGGEVYDPRNLAAYSYAFNSPVSYWDPDGMQVRRSPSSPPPPPPPPRRPVIRGPLIEVIGQAPSTQSSPSQQTAQIATGATVIANSSTLTVHSSAHPNRTDPQSPSGGGSLIVTDLAPGTAATQVFSVEAHDSNGRPIDMTLPAEQGMQQIPLTVPGRRQWIVDAPLQVPAHYEDRRRAGQILPNHQSVNYPTVAHYLPGGTSPAVPNAQGGAGTGVFSDKPTLLLTAVSQHLMQQCPTCDRVAYDVTFTAVTGFFRQPIRRSRDNRIASLPSATFLTAICYQVRAHVAYRRVNGTWERAEWTRSTNYLGEVSQADFDSTFRNAAGNRPGLGAGATPAGRIFPWDARIR